MFNINQFKSKINDYGGPARSNLFFVEIFGNESNYIPSETLRFFCKSVTFPGINLDVAQYNPRNFGMSESMPSGITPDPLSCMFIVDNEQRVTSYFHEWARQIVNYDASQGFDKGTPSNSEHQVYEVEYKNRYSKRMIIRLFSIGNRVMQYVCDLSEVWPTQVSGFNLSWEENDTYITLPVNFAYKTINFSANDPTYAQSRRSEGGLDFFTSIGETAPLSIQKLVNTETRTTI